MKLGGHFTKTASDMGDRIDAQTEDLAGRAADKFEDVGNGAERLADEAARKTRRAGKRAGSELENFFDDVEDLVRRSTDISDGAIANARARVENRLHSARDAATRGVDSTVERSRRAARATDEYVHGNPWAAIGAVALAGIVLGALVGRGQR